eukprot:4509042-Ditylum_brightwellii.AAC.2
MHEVWKVYNTVYLASVRYLLGATAIEDHTLKDIQKILTTKMLPRFGCVSTLPQAVVFGPIKYGGL